jgi:glycogen operon protein
LNWTLLSKHADVHRFVKLLNARRVLRTVEHEHRRVNLNQMLRNATKSWHGVKLGHPDWSHDSHSIAFDVELQREGLRLHLILNAYWESLDFELPQASDTSGPWRRWIDTALDSPDEIIEWQEAAPVPGSTYKVGPRSVVVLVAGRAYEGTDSH